MPTTEPETRPDLIALPFLPLDVTVALAPDQRAAPVERAAQGWAAAGARLDGLTGALGMAGVGPEQIRVTPGGSAANALRVAAAWGSRAALGGVLGVDPAGDFICEGDARAGLDVGVVRRSDDGKTPIYLILLREGAQTFTTLVPRAQRVGSLFQIGRDEWAETAARLARLAPRCFHLNAANGRLQRLLDEAPPDTRLTLNLTGLPARAGAAFELERLIRRAQVLILSDREVPAWLDYLAPLCRPASPAGQAALLLDLLFELTPALELAVVTRAERGLVARARSTDCLALPAFGTPGSARPIVPLDPTGAGDTFSGTLLAELVRTAWRTPATVEGLRALLLPSLVAAALNCERASAVGNLPTRTEVAELLDEAERQAVALELPDRAASAAVIVPGFAEAGSPFGRLVAGIPAAVATNAPDRAEARLSDDFRATHTLVAIGSGSSYSVALGVAALVTRLLPAPFSARAYRPGEYLALGRPGETVLAISQGGNPDIQAAVERARELEVAPFLLTARAGSWTAALGADHLLLHRGESVRSFVNARGPCAALARAIDWLCRFAGRPAPVPADYCARYELARRAVGELDWAALSGDRALVGLASGLLAGPLHELDLKAAECGLEAETYELKGWTHGRWQRAWGRRDRQAQAFLLLETPADRSASDQLVALLERLGGRQPVGVHRLGVEDDPLGLWQQLVQVMLLVERLVTLDPTSLSTPPALRTIKRSIALRPAERGDAAGREDGDGPR